MRILVILALTNLVSYASRNALFAVYPALRERFAVSDAELGLLTTVFLLPHAAATIGFGWAGDRFDRRRVIAAGVVLASAAGALGALMPDIISFGVTRAIAGLATAAVVPVANSILGQIFEGPKKASRLSIFNLGLFLGGVAGFGLGTLLGFPLVVIAIGVPGFGLAVLIVTMKVPDRDGGPKSGTLSTFLGEMIADAKILLGIRTLRVIMVSTTAMAFAAGGYNAWLKDFLTLPLAKHGKGMSEAAANSLLVTALFFGLAGILVGGRLADILTRKHVAGRLWTILLGMSLTIPAASGAILAPEGPLLYVSGFATMFFISMYHAPMAASVDDLAPPGMSVAAQGFVIFTMHMVGTAPSSFVIGLVSDATNLETALWVPTGALVVAAGAMWLATTTFAGDARKSEV